MEKLLENVKAAHDLIAEIEKIDNMLGCKAPIRLNGAGWGVFIDAERIHPILREERATLKEKLNTLVAVPPGAEEVV